LLGKPPARRFSGGIGEQFVVKVPNSRPATGRATEAAGGVGTIAAPDGRGFQLNRETMPDEAL
jgi:hypothetical protein